MIEIENKQNNIVCRGDKDIIIEFLKNKGFKNLDIKTPLMLLSTITQHEYNFYIR